MGRVTNKALNVFTIETTINNRMFDRPLEFLHKNEDDLSGNEQAALKGLKFTLDELPQRRAQAIFDRVPSPVRRHGRLRRRDRGGPRADARALRRAVHGPVEGQADILVAGVPYISPYNVHSFLNPLLVQVMAQGYLFNCYRNAPLVKKGGR